MSDLDRLGAALQSQVTRGKVTDSRIGPRTLLQITGLEGVAQQAVELLLPYGVSARPVVGADVLLVQVMGRGDHIVALGGDAAGNAIADLAPGEVGLAFNGHQIVLRTDRVEVTTPAEVIINAPKVTINAPQVIMPDLPNSGAGLESGGLWKQSGGMRVA